LFPEHYGSPVQIPENRLLIHVRLGDVATLTHGYYGPLPISYYRYLCDQTGMNPIFIGELQSSPYVEALQSAFPSADFISGGSRLDDFQTIRHASNIAVAVSSFSAVAAYLSKARQIHLPIAGLFDPVRSWENDALPLKDPRYIFHRVSNDAWENRYEDHFGKNGVYLPAETEQLEALRDRIAGEHQLLRFRMRLGMERRAFFHSFLRLLSRLNP
jgi:hypothetical protein